MLIIFLTILSINNFKLSLLLEKAAFFSKNVHQRCIETLPKSTQNPQAYAALICGRNITDENLKSNLIKSSLIHLFVVSGSHLLLIDEVLLFLRIPFFLRFLLLGLYGLACHWQAPVVRAWIGITLKYIHSRFRLHLASDIYVFYFGLCSLMLFPEWISSRSLIMSWLAALALSVSGLWRLKNPIHRLMLQSLLIYIFMMPTLWGFGNLHPLSLVFNIILAPLVTFLLLPLAVISSVWPVAVKSFDSICQLFLWLSAQGSEPVVIEKSSAIAVPYLWLFLLGLHLGIHFLRIHIKRRRL